MCVCACVQVLVDVRQVQKEINSISETCQRSFAVVDEKIFQAANQGADSGKKDPAATQVRRPAGRALALALACSCVCCTGQSGQAFASPSCARALYWARLPVLSPFSN